MSYHEYPISGIETHPVTYDEMGQVISRGINYLQGMDPEAISTTREAVVTVIDTVQNDVPSAVGGFGAGFPYHSMDKDGNPIANPEFTRFNHSLLRRINEESSTFDVPTAEWPCGALQGKEGHLPLDCESCSVTAIKPRHVAAAIADVDVFIVAEDSSDNTLARVQDAALRHGFYQSDFSASDALRRVSDFMRYGPVSSLPPADVHLLRKQDLDDALESYKSGQYDAQPGIMSMYAYWKQNKKIDLWFDLVFTGFRADMSLPSDTAARMLEARAAIAQDLGPTGIIQRASQIRDRARVLLEHEPTRTAFIDEIESWHV